MIRIHNVSEKDVDVMIKLCLKDSEEDLTVKTLIENGAFKGDEEELFVVPVINKKVSYIFYVGLGTEETVNAEVVRRSLAKCIKKIRTLKVKKVGVMIRPCAHLCVGGNVKAITEGLLLGDYEFKYTKDQKEELEISIAGVPKQKQIRANQLLEETMNIAKGVIIARDLTNEPANKLYPETLAEKVIQYGKEAGFEVEVKNEDEIKALGMEAFLAVGSSSAHQPRLIVMRYQADANQKEVLGLVGKGLTYDTGGYSLKSRVGMKGMQSDMGGGAAVIGTMYAMAKNKVKRNVVAVIAACENVVAPDSYKPGDIINSMAGKTIEIDNTDAEGRLTLADAITYIIEKEKVDKIIDLATLTGAALHALGTSTTAALTNDEEFYAELQKAAEKTNEQFWLLPSYKEYAKMNKSEVADIKNSGGKYAGTITAGLFVREFVQNKPWIHLDIAGTAWLDAADGYLPKNATGVPVRTLYAMVGSECGCKK